MTLLLEVAAFIIVLGSAIGVATCLVWMAYKVGDWLE